MTDIPPARPPGRTLSRMKDRQSRDRARLDALLADVIWGQVAYVDPEGAPEVLPVALARRGDELVWHGSSGSGWLRLVGAGARVAVSVGTLEALVVGRSRLENSFWYRSAVLYGVPRLLEGAELDAALDTITEHILPGRLEETRPSSAKELAATTALALPIRDWVLKESYAWPDDTAEDRATPVWAGIVPLRTVPGAPVPDRGLDPETPLPPSCRRLLKDD